MPISFGKAKDDDVVSLIAARKYARAVELLKEQLRRKGANPSLRMQLADVLILADKKAEALALLLPLADQFANEGFAAKAVSVLKKVQRLDPGRRDVDARLARLIEEKQREAVVLPLVRPSLGAEAPLELAAGSPADEPGLEIGFEVAPISAPAPLSSAAAATDPSATLPVESPLVPPFQPALSAATPRTSQPARGTPAAGPPARETPAPSAEPLPELASLPALAEQRLPELSPDDKNGLAIEDYDLLYAGGEEPGGEPLVEPEPEEAIALGPPTTAPTPMSEGQFADELMALVDSVFSESPQPSAAATAAAATAQAPSQPIVVSPLFRDFTVDELVAVIQGLKLLAFERGDVILREGEPGASLYMLTSGRVRAFRKDAKSARQNPIADLDEGAFFGEISILTGRPRSASVVALSRCELLELDRPALDEITRAHPHVWDVLREFAQQRGAAARRPGGG